MTSGWWEKIIRFGRTYYTVKIVAIYDPRVKLSYLCILLLVFFFCIFNLVLQGRYCEVTSFLFYVFVKKKQKWRPFVACILSHDTNLLLSCCVLQQKRICLNVLVFWHSKLRQYVTCVKLACKSIKTWYSSTTALAVIMITFPEPSSDKS